MFVIALGSALAVGCTLIVSFDAEPDGAVVEPDASTVIPPEDASQPKPGPTTDGSVTPPTATPEAGSAMPECKELPPIFWACGQEAWLCGRRLSDYPADKDNDILRCAGVATCRAKCPAGCLRLDSPDDECDPCKGKADGAYCGRDLGWTTRNANVSVRCMAGKHASNKACGSGTCPCN